MKALIIYDSVFGNTEQVARAMGDALGAQGDVNVVRVGEVKREDWAGLDLLIVGSPTRAFSATPATKALLRGIPRNGLRGVRVAAFDTRIPESEIEKTPILRVMVRLFGYAAEPIARRLEAKGGTRAVPPAGFDVGGTEGPLLEGELERAADWARQAMATR